MFIAGMLTCLSIISVSGFVTSPAKPEVKTTAVVASTPKPNECDCAEFT